MAERLYRSRTDRKIAGVCGGIAKYFEIDPLIVRIAFVVLVFANGMGLLIYALCWILMPEEPIAVTAPVQTSSLEQPPAADSVASRRRRGMVAVGALLIVIGAVIILQRFVSWLTLASVLPYGIIALGVGVLIRGWIEFQRRRREQLSSAAVELLPRHHFFWGVFTVAVGVAMSGVRIWGEVPSQVLGLLFGSGLLLLGVTLVVAQRAVQLIALVLAALCFGGVVGFGVAQGKAWQRNFQVSCNVPDDELQIEDSELLEHSPRTSDTPTHSATRADTVQQVAPSKPVY